ncbi:hypothetical protein [Cytobacillus dafuensis]|uniref:Uncharacterized protein n=1 Tax=Cytobacillus dafuensis TaxID=1742359 RepID=A0A5B8Z3M6_CYTDA|nr:hypothetical protein [Cytobacillus dafuensis]QED46893.1 hypothetical protein FSZ17_06210 [Cytobacillus dafuensis]
MSPHKQEIENYGHDVNDFEASPFETIRILHDRSELHKVHDQLTFQEKLELAKYDLQLIQNAKKMVEHISKAYDFNTSEKPREEWWWHLDQIAEENLPFGVTSFEQGEVI